jgi:tRNA1Val (adenine37-N6)-methyltransferase
LDTVDLMKELLPSNELYLQGIVEVRSFAHSVPHRLIVTIGKRQKETANSALVIYDGPKVYSIIYQKTLKDFLTIF